MEREELLYEERIRRLQEDITSLRMSRRILMSLLEQLQGERRQEKDRLEKEKLRLQKANSHYVETIWEKNIRIRELEEKLESSCMS